MRLSDYLAATDESPAAFCTRAAGLGFDLNARTVARLATDEEVACRTDTALAIIRTSYNLPAPDGAYVTLRDLVSKDWESEGIRLRPGCPI